MTTNNSASLIDIADRLSKTSDKIDALSHINFLESFTEKEADGLGFLLVALANEVREAHDELYSINRAQPTNRGKP